VHHALEGGVVVTVGNEPQVGERVLDLRALEEPQAAVHPVRHARRQKRLFEDARLGIGAVQDGELAPLTAAHHPLADTVRDELRLVALVEGGVEADRLAARDEAELDRKSTRLNSSHVAISYAVFFMKK